MKTRDELHKELFTNVDRNLLKTFKKYHKENPNVYRMFEKFSLQAFESGRAHYSHWSVANRVRWYTSIDTKGCEFKISNDLIALYARAVVLHNPHLYGFFKFKRMKRVRGTARGFKNEE